jgi:beta-phosphoglucomutase-like phosphatase (HAD superfamily)
VPTPSLDQLTVHWRTALRTARLAVDAAESLPIDERHAYTARLNAEIAPTQTLLQALAHNRHSHLQVLPLVVSPPEARRLLRLPHEIAGCVFNLDGVLVGSADLHIAAWTEAFEPFLFERAERAHGRLGEYAPFNPNVDYLKHIHARPRLDGVREFLASRGIRLPEGEPSDPPGTESVHGLANRKNEALLRRLREHGVRAFDGSRNYLELAHEAGMRCAVVSASANTDLVLERSGLAELVDARVDGDTIRREHLRVKPAPDTLVAACRLIGVDPRHCASFETTRAGVAAGKSAGFDLVVGVDGAIGADRRDALRAEGADFVVGGVGELLEQRLAA